MNDKNCINILDGLIGDVSAKFLDSIFEGKNSLRDFDSIIDSLITEEMLDVLIDENSVDSALDFLRGINDMIPYFKPEENVHLQEIMNRTKSIISSKRNKNVEIIQEHTSIGSNNITEEVKNLSDIIPSERINIKKFFPLTKDSNDFERLFKTKVNRSLSRNTLSGEVVTTERELNASIRALKSKMLSELATYFGKGTDNMYEDDGTFNRSFYNRIITMGVNKWSLINPKKITGTVQEFNAFSNLYTLLYFDSLLKEYLPDSLHFDNKYKDEHQGNLTKNKYKNPPGKYIPQRFEDEGKNFAISEHTSD
jgi:hypothetical protein